MSEDEKKEVEETEVVVDQKSVVEEESDGIHPEKPGGKK